MAIRAVLFDLDDTLLWDERSVEEAFYHTCQFAVAQTAVDAEKLMQAVQDYARQLYATYDTYPFTQMIGINPFEALWGHFKAGEHAEFRKMEQIVPVYRTAVWTQGLKACGIHDEQLGAQLAERFMSERRARRYVYEETFTVLAQLKEQYPLLLLTNGSPDLQQEKLDGIPELEPYFKHIVISGDHAEGKPAVSLFHHALSLLDIEPHEGVMVGDKLTTDILGSQRVGMHNVWINRNDKSLSASIQPEYEVRHLSELFSIIETINKKQLELNSK
ncbi:HAD family hydrolase [Paenibacillus sp. 481]|uniref:HAD family hydrolase n=1 Tax=Paenibacillus sp. 481 TaxID=2835869 RepID=UPI001E60C130|nr:HAD family hydrolase [Paenibacillus sp. 481]UHA73087.1 HAD family hydrolase [Paenibacillus sp. 481]